MRGSPVPPPILALLCFGAMYGLGRYWPILGVIPAPWNRLGWAVVALAFTAPSLAILRFRQARTTVDPRRPEAASSLVTGGVYAWTRNPMYLGLSILLLGWAVVLGALSAFVGPVVFVPLIQRLQIRPEENALRLRFGAEYEAYCQRVNRWFGKRSPTHI